MKVQKLLYVLQLLPVMDVHPTISASGQSSYEREAPEKSLKAKNASNCLISISK